MVVLVGGVPRHLPRPAAAHTCLALLVCATISVCVDERTSARTSAFDETPRVCRCVISPHERGSSTQAWLVTRMETPASPETARSPETNSTPRDTRAIWEVLVFSQACGSPETNSTPRDTRAIWEVLVFSQACGSPETNSTPRDTRAIWEVLVFSQACG